MIVITDIKCIETTRDEFINIDIMQRNNSGVIYRDKNFPFEETTVTREQINGMRIRFNNEEYVIGVSSSVSKKLGSLMEVAESTRIQLELANEKIGDLSQKNYHLKAFQKEVQEAKFLKRLMYFMTGNLPE